jgi:basic membrane lipoprotein Med (substrate-binding protein (PBP1-ABC) superfamily)
MKNPRLALLPLAVALLAVTAGCSAPSAPAEVAALAPTPAPAAGQGPVPGSTSTPAPGSWDSVPIPAGVTLEIVAAADDAETAAAIGAVQEWAEAHGAELVVTRGAGFEQLLASAAAAAPSAVITIGPTALDAVDRVSASNTGQPFLLLGAQLPEPTGNVAAVVWPGASSRDTDYGQATGFAGHAASAIAVGIAAVVEERTGTVFDLGS